MPRRSLAVTTALTLIAGLVGLPASTSPAAAPSTIGAPGAGDPYFPLQGNGGYDVQHYTIALTYGPHTRLLAGVVHINATARQRLTRFDLDLRHDMTASKVLVNGRRAGHAQPADRAHELVITPSRALPAGRPFTVAVTYAGRAHAISDPDGSPDGWIATSDGAFVANEPQGSPTWFPVNNTPTDKATYTVSVNVPKGYTAVSNGRYIRPTRTATRTIWRYRLTKPVSDYLVTATVGRFDLHFGRTGRGVPFVVAIDPTQRAGTALVLAKLPKIVDYFSSVYGAYPFPQTGAIVDDAPNVGYALETATRPLFPSAPDELTLAHELAHQWYGDTVTVRRWRDIWINEGFAEFSTWLWDQHRGGTTMRRHLQQLLARPSSDPVWNPPPGNPGSNSQIFADSVYQRGAGALEALREKVGSAAFFRVMRGWVQARRYGNGTVDEFTGYVQKVLNRDLRHFFFVWLYRNGKP